VFFDDQTPSLFEILNEILGDIAGSDVFVINHRPGSLTFLFQRIDYLYLFFYLFGDVLEEIIYIIDFIAKLLLHSNNIVLIIIGQFLACE